MSKIDVQKIVRKLVQEKDCPPDFKTAFQAGYAEAATDILTKLAPFLEILMENWDSTDMEIFIADEPCDGTQFHITLPEDEADVFSKEYETMSQLLLPE